MRASGQGPAYGRRDMRILRQIAWCAIAIREFVAPRYRPERHYMRGPGPACARREHARIESRLDASPSFR